MSDRVYLDWNATTPLRSEAKQAMAAAWEISGNPSSVHAEGRQARRLVEDARAAVAAAVSAWSQDVVFSSGGTEANALALTPGLRRGAGQPVQRLLVSAIEHASVLSGGRFPAEAIEAIRVTRSGLVDLDHLRSQLADGPAALAPVPPGDVPRRPRHARRAPTGFQRGPRGDAFIRGGPLPVPR